MGDGLFWERKCCLSSEKQFPALLGLLLSSSSPPPPPPRAELELAGDGYTCCILSLGFYLFVNLKLGVEIKSVLAVRKWTQ